MELLVPEGFNMYDIAEAVGKLGTMRPETFLAAARNPAMIRDLDPNAPSLEGYLFPNKYRIYRHTTAQQICRMMTDEFRARWKALQTPANVHDTVTLAAMVEREARLPEERPVVASVFHNRLRIGMKLDCDPTTVYAALLENRYRGTIHRSDLANAKSVEHLSASRSAAGADCESGPRHHQSRARPRRNALPLLRREGRWIGRTQFLRVAWTARRGRSEVPACHHITKKQRVLDFVAVRGWGFIGEREWHELRSALSDISETTLRASGIPIARAVEWSRRALDR